MSFANNALQVSRKHTTKHISYNPASGSVRRKDGHTYTGNLGTNSNNKVSKMNPNKALADSSILNAMFSANSKKYDYYDDFVKTWLGYKGRHKGSSSATVEGWFLKDEAEKSWKQFWSYLTGEGVDYSPMGYGNIGLSGTTGKSTYSNNSLFDYMKYLQDQNNAINIAMNRENNKFAANEAKLQRDWSTEMSNTAHQREVKDLQAAGLNPILSANGGAAVAAGASAGTSNFVGADSSAIHAMAGIIQAALGSNATTTAAALNANAAMYGANKALEGTKYSAKTGYEAKKYGVDRTKYGMIYNAADQILDVAKSGKLKKGAVKNFVNNISNWYSYRPGR